VLQHYFNWKVPSAAAGITWWNFYFDAILAPSMAPWRSTSSAICCATCRASCWYWDGLPQHRARLVTEFIRAQRSRLAIERLPAYAPELNPVEYIWGYWKHHELPNFCPRDFGELSYQVRSLWRQANLSQ